MKTSLLLGLLVVFSAHAHQGHGLLSTGEEVALSISSYDRVDPLRGKLGNFELLSKDYFTRTLRRGDLPVLSMNEIFERNPEEVDAHFFATGFMQKLEEKFQRQGVDGKGTTVNIKVGMVYEDIAMDACGTDVSERPIPMASWDTQTMSAIFSAQTDETKALSSSLDIVAHELAHGVIAFSSKLDAHAEAHALNEAFADIMGIYMESLLQPKQFDWMLGEDTHLKPNCNGVRHLNNPHKGRYFYVSQADDSIQVEHIRDHYSQLYQGEADGGGVHINSGIAPLVFYLLAEGGNHPRLGGIPVKGVGIELAAQIFYRAFTEHLNATSRHADLKNATLSIAATYSEEVRSQLELAWSLVGL